MQRERLTPDRIRRFTCPPGKKQAFLWDDKAPRLAVRATANAKAFVFESKLNRATIRVTIGDVNAWPLESVWHGKGKAREEVQRGAREEANRLQSLVNQGIDPRDEKRARIAQAAAQKAAEQAEKREAEEQARHTLRALCEAYTRHLAAKGKARSSSKAASAFRCHVYDSDIAALPANLVTPHQAAQLVRTVMESGKERTAGVLRAYLSAAFNVAKRAPFDATLPAELIPFKVDQNPVDAIPPIAVNAGNRTLSTDELKAYLAALGDTLPDLALRLALLAGGQRLAQLLRATPADYDTDSGALRLLDPKGKRKQPREHVLPLAPLAAALVADLAQRAKGSKSPWLFSADGERPMSPETGSKRVAEICAGLDGEPFTLRDVRRTCETMLAGMGISRDTRAQLLSHGLSGVQVAHYDRHSYTDEKRAALVAWEGRLEEIRTGKKPANVVRMRGKRKAKA
jgi:integrase